MNLGVRLAGIFGTAVFLITSLPGFYRQIQPHDFAQMATDTLSGVSIFETLLLSLSGAIAAGFIGYIMGDILSHPMGKAKKKVKHIKRPEVIEFVPTYSHQHAEASLPAAPEAPPEVTAPPPAEPPVS